jgi:hypothetical protein
MHSPNGRGFLSRLKHKTGRAARKLSPEYRAKKAAFTRAFLAMMPRSPVFGAPASAPNEASAVMGATPEVKT